MAEFPPFAFTTQESWYGELSFKAAEDGSALSLAGRRFEMHITPASSGAQLVPPVLVLTMDEGRGLSFKRTAGGADDPSTLVFRVPKETANAFPRQEYTADVLEVVGGDRYLFMPVRVTYAEPSGLRAFLSRFLGVSVSFAARQQPIITPLAVPGREGRPGATIITGSMPPVPADGKDGDFYIEDRTASARGRRMYGPKFGGAWPGTPWNIQIARISEVPGSSQITDALLDANKSADLAAPDTAARQPRLAAGVGAPDLPDGAAVDAYAGPAREIIVGPEDLRLQDGETPGGIRILSLGSRVLATFAGALPIPLWKVLFANVHAVHFGVEAIPADAPASQRVSQTARLRAAIAFAEARGAHLNLPQGDIWFGAPPDDTDACLRIGKNMSMSGAGFDTRLMPLPDVAGRHLLMIKPLANTPIQGMFLRHFSIGQVGGGQPGLNALRIETTNPGGYIAGLDVGHLALSPGGPNNRAFEHFNDETANKNGGVFGSTFHNLTVVGGMKFTKTGDSINILQCRISNFGIGIDMSTTSGAATQCIMFNNITSQGGAMRLNGVLQAHIRFNQCEQSFAYTGDTTNDNACITLIGSSQCTISDNNINTHGRCDAIALTGSPDCTIYPNTLCYGDSNFAVRAKFSTGLRYDRQTKDIIFNGQDNAGTSRKFPLVSIDASSSPVIGLPMVQTLKGGFTDAGGANFNPGLRATLLSNGTVRLTGNLNGGVDAQTGTRKQGTLLATLPTQMRPNKAQYLPVIVNQPSVGFSNGMLLVDTVGGISVVTMPLGAFGLDNVSFQLA